MDGETSGFEKMTVQTGAKRIFNVRCPFAGIIGRDDAL